MHSIPTPVSHCQPGRKHKSLLLRVKRKFYFLFLWSLIADQSWPFRLELPASSCSWAGFQATLWMRAAHPMHCPLLSCACQGQSLPLTLLSGCSENQGAAAQPLGMRLGFFPASHDLQESEGCVSGSSIFPQAPPGSPGELPFGRTSLCTREQRLLFKIINHTL